MPKFWNSLFHLHTPVGMKYVWVGAKPFPISIPQHFSNPDIFHTYLPIKMEQTECTETSAYKIQMQGNYPQESTQ